MSYKQENYITNLLTYKTILENYQGYVGYVLNVLQKKPDITMKQASCIIDTLKGMIEIEKTKENGDSDDGDELEEEVIE